MQPTASSSASSADTSVQLDQIQTLLAEHGYEVEAPTNADEVLLVKDSESGLQIRCVLEDNILFSTIHCMAIEKTKLTADVLHLLLDAENGISTSSFQLYDRKDGSMSLALNNFCKLQSMGSDDEDDILSCLEFLAVDAYAARALLDGRLD